jgi:zinc transport system substrate-binding protein
VTTFIRIFAISCLLMGVLLTGAACGKENSTAANKVAPTYVVTIRPLEMIIKRVVEGRAEVHTLLAGAASPHTYDPLPSDAKKSSAATALIYVGEGLDDWAVNLNAKRRIKTLALVPSGMLIPMVPCTDHDHHGHSHGENDPHFWTDPLVVKEMLPGLVKYLSEADPEGATVYKANATKFANDLEALHRRLEAQLAPIRGAKVILFHPSFLYLLQRYGLEYAGVIEESPGKEATPKHLAALQERLRKDSIKAIFSEPQLNPRTAEAIAGETGVALGVLDPNGALASIVRYEDLLLVNAETLRNYLQ